MKTDELMRIIVNELIAQHGIRYRISSREIQELLTVRFRIEGENTRPTDYCYDRVNKGIVFDKRPSLFRYPERGMLECLGEHYPFTGEIKYARDETVVGYWKDGHLHKNDNWNKLGLR